MKSLITKLATLCFLAGSICFTIATFMPDSE